VAAAFLAGALAAGAFFFVGDGAIKFS